MNTDRYEVIRLRDKNMASVLCVVKRMEDDPQVWGIVKSGFLSPSEANRYIAEVFGRRQQLGVMA